MSYPHGWGVQQQVFLTPPPWGPWEGSKGQISFIFNYKVNFKDFYTKLCVRSHKWKIHNRMFVLLPGSCPRGRTSGCWGLPGVGGGVKKKQDASKIFILGSNWWSWGEVKRSNIIKFWLPFLYQTLCVFSQIKVRKHIKQILLFGSCPRDWTWGCWGVKNLSMGICNGAPSTARSSFTYVRMGVNSVDPDQAGPIWVVWSGSTPIVKKATLHFIKPNFVRILTNKS